MREIQLGVHKLPVFAQPEPRVWRKLVPRAKEIVRGIEVGDNPTIEALIPALEGRAYELLSLFIPALADRIPEHEWHGYASREAMERGEDSDEAIDRAPNHAQIVEAVEAVMAVHRWTVYSGAFKQWIDPKTVRPQINLWLLENLPTLLGDASSNSPSPSGDSDPSKPSTTDPTPGPSEDSPALESSTS